MAALRLGGARKARPADALLNGMCAGPSLAEAPAGDKPPGRRAYEGPRRPPRKAAHGPKRRRRVSLIDVGATVALPFGPAIMEANGAPASLVATSPTPAGAEVVAGAREARPISAL